MFMYCCLQHLLTFISMAQVSKSHFPSISNEYRGSLSSLYLSHLHMEVVHKQIPTHLPPPQKKHFCLLWAQSSNISQSSDPLSFQIAQLTCIICFAQFLILKDKESSWLITYHINSFN